MKIAITIYPQPRALGSDPNGTPDDFILPPLYFGSNGQRIFLKAIGDLEKFLQSPEIQNNDVRHILASAVSAITAFRDLIAVAHQHTVNAFEDEVKQTIDTFPLLKKLSDDINQPDANSMQIIQQFLEVVDEEENINKFKSLLIETLQHLPEEMKQKLPLNAGQIKMKTFLK